MTDSMPLIRRMLTSEQDEVENLLDEAFRDNPITRFLYGGRPRRGRILLLNRWMVNAENVHTLVATDGQNVLGALKYADYPYCSPRGWRSITSLVDFIRSWGWRSIINLPLFSMHDHHPDWPHRHLIIVGVAPGTRDKGVGSQLLTHFVNGTDTDEVNAMLETDTERAKALYERFGFKVFKTESFNKKRYQIWYLKRTFKKESD